MFYLIATVVLNVIVSAVLKMFPRFGINPLQAIVVNYCVCVPTGCIFTGSMPFNNATMSASWLPWVVLMGLAFIAIFNLTAFCTRVSGMTTTVIASKLSLVIPVVFSIIWYHDRAGLGKIAGILLAFPAVYLTTRTPKSQQSSSSILWPAVLFIVSGGLDTLVNYIQATFLHTAIDQSAATIICFATAAIAGLIVLAVQAVSGNFLFEWKNLLAGICLGVPNFFSIYFLVHALNSSSFQSSATIPLLNISILVVSTLAAIAFFGERAGRQRILGLGLATIAILLIAFGDQ